MTDGTELRAFQGFLAFNQRISVVFFFLLITWFTHFVYCFHWMTQFSCMKQYERDTRKLSLMTAPASPFYVCLRICPSVDLHEKKNYQSFCSSILLALLFTACSSPECSDTIYHSCLITLQYKFNRSQLSLIKTLKTSSLFLVPHSI